jgi:hypothetical protein
VSPTKLTDFTRIIIVDDDETEGKAIQDALTQLNLASLFVHAKDRGALPVKPFTNARIVFLDLEFFPGSTERSRASTALSYLSTVVSENCFYVLVVWSSHVGSLLETEFKDLLSSHGSKLSPCIPPIFLAKSSCQNPSTGKFSGIKITNAIKKNFKTIKSYELFINWENTVSSTVTAFLSGLLNGEDQRELSRKIHALAWAYGGKKYRKNTAKNALLTLNEALRGLLDSSVINEDYSRFNAQIFKNPSGLSGDKLAELNEKLLLNPDKSRGSGCVFKTTRNESKRYTNPLVEDWPEDGIDVMVDVTPICDVAQDKNEFVYYVYGALVPSNTRLEKSGFLYDFDHSFRYDGKNYKLALNLKSLETVRKDAATVNVKIIQTNGRGATGKLSPRSIDNDGSIIFKFKDGVVVDFQHKIAHHNSRPGHTLLQPSI